MGVADPQILPVRLCCICCSRVNRIHLPPDKELHIVTDKSLRIDQQNAVSTIHYLHLTMCVCIMIRVGVLDKKKDYYCKLQLIFVLSSALFSDRRFETVMTSLSAYVFKHKTLRFKSGESMHSKNSQGDLYSVFNIISVKCINWNITQTPMS